MTGTLPPEAYLVGLASLSEVGPARLAAFAAAGPQASWRALCAGRLPAGLATAPFGRAVDTVLARLRSEASRVDVTALWRAHVDAGIGVTRRGAPSYPAMLERDPEPPEILFHRGDLDVLAGVRVAVVGTRSCTRSGHDTARTLGEELARVGVGVLSGLALGIDGAAHAGVLDALAAVGRADRSAAVAPPVAVVGSGLDVVYPRAHRALWRRVAATGLLLGEYPLGTPPLRWHFPARNRILVSLADLVVVVESPQRGGAMLTAELAVERDVPVMAVPGPLGAPHAEGTNMLLAAGHPAVRHVGDVLAHLRLSLPVPRRAAESRPAPSGDDDGVLDAVGWQPATLEQVLARTGASVGAASAALARLERDGWVARRGAFYERVARPSG